MPISWCELVDAMRERRLEWDAERAWDPEGRFVGADRRPFEEQPPARTVEEALRMLPPYRAGARDGVERGVPERPRTPASTGE